MPITDPSRPSCNESRMPHEENGMKKKRDTSMDRQGTNTLPVFYCPKVSTVKNGMEGDAEIQYRQQRNTDTFHDTNGRCRTRSRWKLLDYFRPHHDRQQPYHRVTDRR